MIDLASPWHSFAVAIVLTLVIAVVGFVILISEAIYWLAGGFAGSCLGQGSGSVS